mgnify:FL=1
MIRIPHGGVIDFRPDSNNDSVLSLNREDVVLDENALVKEFYHKCVLPYYESLDSYSRKEKTSEMLEVWYAVKSISLQMHRRLLDKIMVDGEEIGQLKNNTRATWSSKRNRLSDIAEKSGYKVIYTNKNALLEKALEYADIPEISTIKERVLGSAKMRGITKSESGAMEGLARTISAVFSASEKYRQIIKQWAESDTHAKTFPVRLEFMPGYITVIGEGVRFGSVYVYLAENENTDARVFNIYQNPPFYSDEAESDGNLVVHTWGSRDPSIAVVAINIKNEIVKEAMDSGRVDILLPEIIYRVVEADMKMDQGNGYIKGNAWERSKNVLEDYYEKLLALEECYRKEIGRDNILKSQELSPEKFAPGDSVQIKIQGSNSPAERKRWKIL